MSGSAQLSQGIWRRYKFAKQELDVLQDSLKRGEAIFRMEGSSSLPLDRASQLMQWDIGYGKFSGGLTYRSKPDILYTLNEVNIELRSMHEYRVSKSGITQNKLVAGFDKDAQEEYACFEFDLSQLLHMENSIISTSCIGLYVDDINSDSNLHFHTEMVLDCEERNYEKIREIKIIERIGYDFSISDIKKTPTQRFVFDTYSINEMLENSIKNRENSKAVFIISASTQKLLSKSQYISCMDSIREKRPSLIVNYIKKRRNPPQIVSNLRKSIENDMIKIEWDLPKDDGYRGAIVVKNPFIVPCSPYDGQKLYGGVDSYTYDNFGDKEIPKYYAVFSYDDVHNFSKPVYIEINSDK